MVAHGKLWGNYGGSGVGGIGRGVEGNDTGDKKDHDVEHWKQSLILRRHGLDAVGVAKTPDSSFF